MPPLRSCCAFGALACQNFFRCEQYTIAEYRDKLYAEIVKRKKELRRQEKEREAREGAAAGGERHHRHRHRSSRSSRQPSEGDSRRSWASWGCDDQPTAGIVVRACIHSVAEDVVDSTWRASVENQPH